MKKFKLYHIKSFEESEEIEIKPITVFVGKNSCGKSSLLRFPVLLAQTFKEDISSPLLLFGEMLDYGNYDDVVNRHSNKPFGFSLEFGPELRTRLHSAMVMYRMRSVYKEEEYARFIRRIEKVVLYVQIARPNKKMIVQELRLEINSRNVFTLVLKENSYHLYLRNFLRKDVSEEEDWEEHISIDASFVPFRRFIPVFHAGEWMRSYIYNSPEIKEKKKKRLLEIVGGYSRDKITEKQRGKKWVYVWTSLILAENLWNGVYRHLDHYANEVSYLGPFRESPKRTYRDSESNFDDVGVYGEHAGMLLRQDSQNNNDLLEAVSDWFYEAMGCTLDIQEISSSLFSLVVKNETKETGEEIDNIIDVGYGISQVLPIVTLLLKGDERDEVRYFRDSRKRMFIIEQPELHLHPAAQAELANLFVKSSQISRSRRILVETHSEHLIRKLQVLIADPKSPITHDQVAFYYVEKDDTGNSYVKKMKVCENGQFEDAWPAGFFDKSYELASELLFANSKR